MYVLINVFYPTTCVTFRIAPKMAKANQRTNTHARRIARGSIHFARFPRE
jgi:hypothetical protein